MALVLRNTKPHQRNDEKQEYKLKTPSEILTNLTKILNAWGYHMVLDAPELKASWALLMPNPPNPKKSPHP